MQYREFGKTGIKVSEIGFGTWAMGGMWGPRNDKLAVEALNLFLDLGGNFFDTASVYGDGHSERLIGNVVRKRKTREKVFIATKIPPKDYHWPALAGSDVRSIFPSSWIRGMTEMSLKNLQTDCLDLQQLHVWASSWLHQGDWLEELRRLQKEGKIRFLGISINDHEPDTALMAVTSGLIDSVQVIYNIFDQAAAEKLLPLCRNQGVSVIVRVPLDEGGLTGQLTPNTNFGKKDWRRFYFNGHRLKETYYRVEKLKEFLNGEANEAKTIPDLALKFCLSRPEVSTVIPGMRRAAHVTSNCLISNGKSLSSATLERLKRHKWQRNFYPHYLSDQNDK